jgi:hypothetical protein
MRISALQFARAQRVRRDYAMLCQSVFNGTPIRGDMLEPASIVEYLWLCVDKVFEHCRLGLTTIHPFPEGPQVNLRLRVFHLFVEYPYA